MIEPKKLLLNWVTRFKKFTQKNSAYIILALLASSTAFFSLQYLPTPPVISDSADYETIALNLISNRTYAVITGDLIYPPGYPVFLTGIYGLLGYNQAYAYAAQYGLIFITSILLFAISQRFFKLNRTIATLIGALYIVWPYSILFGKMIGSEILFVTILISALYYLLAFVEQPTQSTAIKLGLLFSLGVLVRSTILLLPLGLGLAFACATYLSTKKPIWFNLPSFKQCSAVIIVFCLGVIPWITFISLQEHRFIPIASNLTAVFTKGNRTLAYLGTQVTPTWADIAQAKLYNIFLFWKSGADGYHVTALTNKYPIASLIITAYKLFFYIMIACGFYSLTRLKNNLVLTMWLVIGYTWALHIVLFPFPRYTYPIIPLMMMLAVLGIQSLYEKYKKI